MSDIEKTVVIEEGSLNEVPEFYDSVTDNPVTDLLKNRTNSNRFLKFVGVREFTLSIDARTYVNPPGLFVSGLNNFSFAHKSKREVLPFVYSPVLDTLVFSSGVSADRQNIYVDVSNFNAEAKTARLVIYIYELFGNF